MTSVRKGYLRLAMQSLRLSRTRSFMTMLGIVIGIVAVVVIVGVGEGVKRQVGSQINRYGSDVLLVRPSQGAGNTLNGLGGGVSSMLSPNDPDVIRRVPGVRLVAPLSAIKGSAQGDYTVNNPLVIATTYELGDIMKQKVEYGGFFTAADGDRAVVLGADIAHKLFSDNGPLGQKLTFRGKTFMVAGVFKPFSAAPFSLEANYNDAVFIPYIAAQGFVGSAPQIDQIFVKAQPGTNVQQLAGSLQAKLTESHGGTEDSVVLAAGSKKVGQDHTLRLLTLMTIGMAVVALMVGGVGIMNMMLVSVTERIHEIGLRKAIGATNRQILRQFVTEAFVLCLVGAIIGLVASLATIGFLRVYTSLQPVIVWWVALLVPLVALVIGVFFGAIPALKAARMDPIEALRHE